MHLPVSARPVEAANGEPTPLSMRDAQLRMMPLAMALVFAIFALSSWFTAGELGEAIGLGAFMAFWIGGGFGAIMGGALWNHHNEASLYKD